MRKMAKQGDPLWQQAVDWIVREHEGGLLPAERDAFCYWMAESPLHRKAYDEAARLWLLTGLVPPAGDFECPQQADDADV